MQIQAGMVVLSFNMNKKTLNPPFNLLCFKYCFCCNPFCEEVIGPLKTALLYSGGDLGGCVRV